MPIARGIVYNGRDAYHDRVYVRPKVEIVIKIVIEVVIEIVIATR